MATRKSNDRKSKYRKSNFLELFLDCFLASKKFSFIGQWEVLQQVKSLYTSRFVLLFKNSLMFLYGSEVNLHGAIFYNALQKRW